MTTGIQESAMKAAASQLRAIVLAAEDGTCLGDERKVLEMLGVSRTTLRQVARLLEREGLLAVKRGSNGGYYARRPTVHSVEAAVTDYLEILEIRTDELSTIASIIWTEAVRQAAGLDSKLAGSTATRLTRLVRGTDETITYGELIGIEQEIRSEVFKLIDSPYIKFLFQINISFGAKRLSRDNPAKASTHFDAAFIADWRKVKLLELNAIANGDQELGILAAGRSRELWRTVSQFQPASGKAPRNRAGTA
ncbi:MAG: GntR family transcriptional regulator [Sphingomonadales bacterium]|nr:GntR family transcriptional regulator [Sphingomonadales bacterium]